MERLAIILALVVLILAGTLPAKAQDGENRPPITPDNVAYMTLLAQLGHGQITDFAWAPDGQTLALAGSPGIWLYNADDLETDPDLLKTGPVQIMAYRPYGAALASSSGWRSGDNAVWLWDVATGESLHVLEGHTDEVNSVAFNPDGTMLASGSNDNTVRVWDTATGRTLHVLASGTSDITSLAFSPDWMMLAAGSRDGKVQLWNLYTWQGLTAQATGAVHSMAFDLYGEVLAVGSADGSLQLWRSTSGFDIERTALSGHIGAVNSVAYSPNGVLLVSGSEDDTVRLWDTAMGESLAVLEAPKGVLRVAFSPDGKTLASLSHDGTVRLWGVILVEEEE